LLFNLFFCIFITNKFIDIWLSGFENSLFQVKLLSKCFCENQAKTSNFINKTNIDAVSSTVNACGELYKSDDSISNLKRLFETRNKHQVFTFV